MTDIEIIGQYIQEWKAYNPCCKPQKVTIPFDMWIRIVNLPIWDTKKWAAMLNHEKDLILFGLPINHFG